ncbi:unnamed protein product [Dicrocoelium dendriticum]|nr:unnamed protein product [Dicrocoelium dendriticum]
MNMWPEFIRLVLVQSQTQCDKLAQRLKRRLGSHRVSDRQDGDQKTTHIRDQTQSTVFRTSDPCRIGWKDDLRDSQFVDSADRSPSFRQPSDASRFSDSEPIGVDISCMNLVHPAAILRTWLFPLVGRYNDLFTTVRVDTMQRLQTVGQADYEKSQRTIFYAVQVCFAVTRQFLRRLYPNTPERFQNEKESSFYYGETYQEEHSSAKIPLTSQQLTNLTEEVLNRMVKRPPRVCACYAEMDPQKRNIRSPAQRSAITSAELGCLKVLLHKVCSLAWSLMSEKRSVTSSPRRLDDHASSVPRIWYVDADRSAKPGDAYDEKCYRRSFDSDSASGVVHHYVWPCLILYSRTPRNFSGSHEEPPNKNSKGSTTNVTACVLVKGEACTRESHYDSSKNFAKMTTETHPIKYQSKSARTSAERNKSQDHSPCKGRHRVE